MVNKTDNIDNDAVDDVAEVSTSRRGKRNFIPMEYSTLNTDTKEGKIAKINALNGAKSLANNAADPINVVNVMAIPSTRTQTGNACQNTYLFTDDGRILFSQSNGIAKTINEIMEVIDYDFNNTSNGYITVKMEESELKGGQTYKQFMLIDL